MSDELSGAAVGSEAIDPQLNDPRPPYSDGDAGSASAIDPPGAAQSDAGGPWTAAMQAAVEASRKQALSLEPADIYGIEQDVVLCYFWEDNERREHEEINRSEITADQFAILASVEQTHRHFVTAVTTRDRYRRLDSFLTDKSFGHLIRRDVRLEAAREYESALSGLYSAAKIAREIAKSGVPSLLKEENSLKPILDSYLSSLKNKPQLLKYVVRIDREYHALLSEDDRGNEGSRSSTDCQ